MAHPVRSTSTSVALSTNVSLQQSLHTMFFLVRHHISEKKGPEEKLQRLTQQGEGILSQISPEVIS